MLLFTMDTFFKFILNQYIVKCKVPLEYVYSIIASGTLLNHIIYKENTKCNMIKFKETLRL